MKDEIELQKWLYRPTVEEWDISTATPKEVKSARSKSKSPLAMTPSVL